MASEQSKPTADRTGGVLSFRVCLFRKMTAFAVQWFPHVVSLSSVPHSRFCGSLRFSGSQEILSLHNYSVGLPDVLLSLTGNLKLYTSQFQVSARCYDDIALPNLNLQMVSTTSRQTSTKVCKHMRGGVLIIRYCLPPTDALKALPSACGAP